MNNQLKTASATEPRLEPQSSEDRFKITFWLGRYEGILFLNLPRSYERYSRVLTRFYLHFPEKHRTFDYLRPDFVDYRDDRLKEGASPTTVAMELTVLRGFWRWMLRMGADGVLLNPVIGVKVENPSKKRRLGEMLVEVWNDAIEPAA